MRKNYFLLNFLLIITLTVLFNKTSNAQHPTILIDGTTILVSDVSKFPYWLGAGQSLATGNKVHYISVLEYNVVSSSGIGNDLIFDKVVSVSSLQTVPQNKAWKIEAVALDETAGMIGPTGATGENVSYTSTNHYMVFADGNDLYAASTGVLRKKTGSGGFLVVDLGENVGISRICKYNGNLIFAGSFSSIKGVAANNIAMFDGTNWYRLVLEL